MNQQTSVLIFYYGEYHGERAIDRRLSDLVVRAHRLSGTPYPFLTHVSMVVTNTSLCHAVDLTADDGIVITPLTPAHLKALLDGVYDVHCLRADVDVNLETLINVILRNIVPLNLLAMYHNFKNGEFSYDSCTTPARRLLVYLGFGGERIQELFTAGQLYQYTSAYNNGDGTNIIDDLAQRIGK